MINNTVSPSSLFSKPATPGLSGLFPRPAASPLAATRPAPQPTGGMSVATPAQLTKAQPLATRQITPTVDTSGIPADKLAALNAGGLKGQDLVNAQSSLADYYKNQGSTGGGTTGIGGTTGTSSGTGTTGGTGGTTDTTTTSFPGLVGRLATAAGGSPELQTAQNNLADAIAKQRELESGIAGQYGKIESQAIPLEFQQGREQALARQFAGQEAAAQGAVTAAQTAVGQGLTAQGQEIGALGTAAGLIPEALRYGVGGGSSLNPQDYASQLASAVISARMPYNDAVSSLGYAGGAGKAFLDQAILKGGGDLTQIQARTSGIQNVLGTLPQLQSANTAAKGIETTLTNFIDQNPDLNPSDAAFSNSVNQWIQGKQLTDPRYQTLFNYLSEYANTLAPVLGVGGDPTNLKTEIAQGFLNAKASGASIKSVIQNMSQLADDKVKNIQSGAYGGGPVAGGTSPGTSSSADPLGIL